MQLKTKSPLIIQPTKCESTLGILDRWLKWSTFKRQFWGRVLFFSPLSALPLSRGRPEHFQLKISQLFRKTLVTSPVLFPTSQPYILCVCLLRIVSHYHILRAILLLLSSSSIKYERKHLQFGAYSLSGTVVQWLAPSPQSKKVLGSILSFCVEFASSARVCVGFLWALRFPPPSKTHM